MKAFMRFVLICQTMMSSIKVRPGRRLRVRADPSFTMSTQQANPLRNLFFLIARTALPMKGVVEPDGFEPTTSCLQSTRSPS